MENTCVVCGTVFVKIVWKGREGFLRGPDQGPDAKEFREALTAFVQTGHPQNSRCWPCARSPTYPRRWARALACRVLPQRRRGAHRRLLRGLLMPRSCLPTWPPGSPRTARSSSGGTRAWPRAVEVALQARARAKCNKVIADVNQEMAFEDTAGEEDAIRESIEEAAGFEKAWRVGALCISFGGRASGIFHRGCRATARRWCCARVRSLLLGVGPGRPLGNGQ